jgi:hypothetical protein
VTVVASAPVSGAASRDVLASWEAVTHCPIVPSCDVQTSSDPQPFPPVPRHPGSQAWLDGLQTRPDVAPPQSLSAAHPQVSDARQTAPAPDAVQFFVWLVVHSTQRRLESHTLLLEQSLAFRHCTHRCGCSMVSQTGSAVVQSALLLHGSLVHCPTAPPLALQYLPVEQLSTPPSRTRQPAVQTPVLVAAVSQYSSGWQSVSLAHPHVADAVMQTGVAWSVAHAPSLTDEQTRHSPASGELAGWQAGMPGVEQGSGPGFVAE